LAAVLRRLAEDPEKALKMGEEGRRRVLERWTAENMVKQYLRLYEELMRK
jgi:glycosyltransferase involved in cell wall biosynthesis